MNCIKIKVTCAMLFCLLTVSHPVLADDPDLQATLQKMQDLLEQQQKQLDEQRKELTAQSLLIKELQGSSKARPLSNDVPDVVYPEEGSTTVTAKQNEPETVIPTADQSGQQKAVLALAKQQVDSPDSAAGKEQVKEQREEIKEEAKESRRQDKENKKDRKNRKTEGEEEEEREEGEQEEDQEEDQEEKRGKRGRSSRK